MVPPPCVRDRFHEAIRDCDLALVEGVMGLFDGFDYDDETGSSAEVAKLLAAPVNLVLDPAKMARSAAALARGFQTFDPRVPVAGFIVNRVGSDGHGRGVARAIEAATGLPVLGWLPRVDALRVPERHLGLVPTAEPGRWDDFLHAAGAHVAQHIDIARLLSLAGEAPTPTPRPAVARPSCGARLAVARDEAFHFTYEDNLELLRVAGAELVFFSPLRDAALPLGATGVILSGGFPELFAAPLAANAGLHAALRQAHAADMPIYAECGGLMFLTQGILDAEGQEHPMVGLLPGRARMAGRLTLGYRLAQAAGDSWLLPRGETVRGHEFHYSTWEDRPATLPPAFVLTPPRGGASRPEGAQFGSLWASYVHLHFASREGLAERIVAACARARPAGL
jgi:cobyrinic acid a,c-diamide synthase